MLKILFKKSQQREGKKLDIFKRRRTISSSCEILYSGCVRADNFSPCRGAIGRKTPEKAPWIWSCVQSTSYAGTTYTVGIHEERKDGKRAGGEGRCYISSRALIQERSSKDSPRLSSSRGPLHISRSKSTMGFEAGQRMRAISVYSGRAVIYNGGEAGT